MLHPYKSIEELKSVLSFQEDVHWLKVYNLYTSQEYEKWLSWHGEDMTFRHFIKYHTKFSDIKWLRGKIQINKLYPITMSLGTPWIRKLACSKINCDYSLVADCKCTDPIEKVTPTLEKVLMNINKNAKFVPSKIPKIREYITKEGLKNIFIIIDTDKIPYVFDGNSRLISVATMPDMETKEITCFLGII